MKTISQNDFSTSRAVRRFAKRNYETYKMHCATRKFIPMPLDEFLENYTR